MLFAAQSSVDENDSDDAADVPHLKLLVGRIHRHLKQRLTNMGRVRAIRRYSAAILVLVEKTREFGADSRAPGREPATGR